MLLFVFVASVITSIPLININAQAQTTPTLVTYPIIDAIPNPVGVGQVTLLKTGILQQIAGALNGWTGITITVTKPDGTTQTLGPFKTDSTGSTFTQYTPDQVGTYILKTNFPEQTNPVTFYNNEGGNTILAGTIMKASTATTNLTVQQEPLAFYPGHALPTEYWSRPIDPQLREWYSVSGNWVTRPDNSLALYNDDAPETAHVLWANPITTGGLMGGLWGDGVPSSADAGDAYEGKFPGSVILNGILYYQRTDTEEKLHQQSLQLTYTPAKNGYSKTTPSCHLAKSSTSIATTMTAHSHTSGPYLAAPTPLTTHSLVTNKCK